MKKLVVFAVLAAIVASCADDNPPQIEIGRASCRERV